MPNIKSCPLNLDPPAHLSERSQQLWRDHVPSRARSAGRLAMVQAALEALDRAEMARAETAASGMVTTTKTTGAMHVNPLVKVEREARAQFLSAWHMLGLHWDNRVDGMDLEHWQKNQEREAARTKA